jgi:NAD+ diphosphatase
MAFCTVCGAALEMRLHEGEGGPVPWCPACGDWRFERFNAAVSMVTRDRATGNLLLVRQYGRKDWILVAGYLKKGETAEEAVRRETREETGLSVVSMCFNRSRFFPPSETLLLNFATETEGEVVPNAEIDEFAWVPPEKAVEIIKPASFAQFFLRSALGLPPAADTAAGK